MSVDQIAFACLSVAAVLLALWLALDPDAPGMVDDDGESPVL